MASTHTSPLRFFQKSSPLFFIAGPCVIESEKQCLDIADTLAKLSERYKVDVIFKASYDKANRTSNNAFRGPGREDGLRILSKVKQVSGLSTITDFHVPADAVSAAQAVDILQIPAFLCRQTDMLAAAGATGKIVNIKKGQFVAPHDMRSAAEKTGAMDRVWLTERGTFFGYNRLVVDFTGILTMKEIGVPVVFDATHSVQQPSAQGGCSGGKREQALPLARAAVSVGVDGLFFEVHEDPDSARCDGPNSLFLRDFEEQVPRLLELRRQIP